MKTHILDRRKSLLFFILHVLALGSIFAQPEDPGIGAPAPEFILKDLDGNEITMNSYRGQFVVLHIATTWCPYCNAEAPYLEELYQQYEEQEVAVLIIDVREPGELVDEKLRQRFGLTFPVLLDTDGQVAGAFAPPEVLPELARDEIMLAANILIDPEGNIQYISRRDSRNFYSKVMHLKEKLDELLQAN